MTAPGFPSLLQAFFSQRLIAERGVSAHTVASYRDTFELLLGFAHTRLQRAPSALAITDLDAPLILEFLDDLETTRANSAQTRNLRLTAIRSFMTYASLRDPTCLPTARRVLAISPKRFDRPTIDFLTRGELDALLAAPDTDTFSGHRDAVLLAVLYNSGARVSEIARLTNADVLVDRQCALQLHGKGRKQRTVPLWTTTARRLRAWQTCIDPAPEAPVFPNRFGRPISRSGINQRLQTAITTAAIDCPSLATRSISPHTMRHTTAMHLLQSGVDITVIALWLGHEDTATTHRYVEADLAMKKAALDRVDDPGGEPVQFTPRDQLLAFLEQL